MDTGGNEAEKAFWAEEEACVKALEQQEAVRMPVKPEPGVMQDEAREVGRGWGCRTRDHRKGHTCI